MVKKKRPSDNNDGSTTESCDENNSNNLSNSGGSCPHINKSVEPTKLRKAIRQSGGIQTSICSECPKEAEIPINDHEDDMMYEYVNSIWLCLKCGSQLCGRSKNKHAVNHYTTPRSDQHALAVNTTNWTVWCYTCDNEVNSSSSKKLLECITFAKKEANQINNIQNKIVDTITAMKPLLDGYADVSETIQNSATSTAMNVNPQILKQQTAMEMFGNSIDKLPRVRGLSNLGNTCFFNAVVQCLAQTPYLLEVLKELSEDGEKFQLPGGKLSITEDKEITMQPISGLLNSWGMLTKTLHDTLEELQTVSGGVYNPRSLLQQLTSKWPQFGGGDQHDSHELLRHLLESVRAEDLRRYQSEILKSLGYTSKVDPQTVEEDVRKKIKFYGEQANDRILKPEQVFRGFLVSTLTCQECFHTSSRHEYFLDISLPVSVEKPQPPNRRKPSPEPILNVPATQPTVSKTQSRKQKRQERKAKRLSNVTSLANSLQKSGSQSSSMSESDADVEDNVTDDAQVTERRNLPLLDANGNAVDDLKSPQNPEKRDDTPENPYKDEGPSSSSEFPDMEPITGNESSASNVVCEATLSSKGLVNLYKKQQQSSSDLAHEVETLSIDEAKRTRIRRQRTFSHMDWSTTLAPRYQCEDGELSLQSCLNNFTAMELMTGNNKVGCDACTEKINGKKGKTIYTNATKQFLISSPPAVLILHLKRFQVGPRCMFRKITKHVSFPLTLDIAPFCGSKVKKLPNIRPHQKNLLYSLYGVVEHSGGMHGGHYVAYVKVRPKLNQKDSRWKYLPQGSKSELDQIDEQKACLDEQLAKARAKEFAMSNNDSDDSMSNSSSSSDNEEGAVGFTEESNVDPPPGKWYYVSDSRVQEASEESVLNAQAYLLFYERIF